MLTILWDNDGVLVDNRLQRLRRRRGSPRGERSVTTVLLLMRKSVSGMPCNAVRSATFVPPQLRYVIGMPRNGDTSATSEELHTILRRASPTKGVGSANPAPKNPRKATGVARH
jgi:hypothetical protein